MTDEIAVLIIEDEPLWAQGLAQNLDAFGFSVAGAAHDFESGALALGSLQYDIVLLDIHLQGRESGIELGQLLSTVYQKPFIFITASYDAATALNALRARPSAYLTKPVNPASLFATIQTALHNFSARAAAPVPRETAPAPDSFFVKQGDKYKKVFWKDVVSLRSEKNYTGVLNASDGTTSYIRSTLPKTLRYLVPAGLQEAFIQVNRAEAVQLSFIRELAREEVRTAFGSFSVTESYLKPLKEKLRILG
ncbi:response regulator transcription factor [Flaviaesturariibacter amylovorans]|uniref:Response regulatory domain-containing protein n=1 Tax=Flaviaesturariibacter amylovorans TaxID=1084520 RepID=A0ABP8GFG1_9BACT